MSFFDKLAAYAAVALAASADPNYTPEAEDDNLKQSQKNGPGKAYRKWRKKKNRMASASRQANRK